MFASTGDGPELEALIDERSHELEMRTDHLSAAILDLERREERAVEIRNAVEDMLRRGSAELDERQGDLDTLARELGARGEQLASAEAELADRTQELGAVELRRAAVERREEALTERERALETIAAELQDRERRYAEIEDREQELAAQLARVAELQAQVVTPPAEVADAHVLIVPGDRYRLIEREEPPPEPGSRIELDGIELVVTRHAASPLPGDRRPCVIVEPEGRGEGGRSPDGPEPRGQGSS
jgi:DNA repair exonuclease SbcCD ATPase subunit